jgi:hypothetical protein
MFGIFGPKKENVIGSRIGLNGKGLHKLHFSPNIFGVLISRKMRRAVSDVCMELICS